MIELLIFLLFTASILVAQTAVAVVYKIKTHSKKSLWRIMNEDV